MPFFDTRDFGRLEIDETALVEFPHGLPGFEDHHRFALIAPDECAPLIFLQSTQSTHPCFIALPVDTILPGYDLWLGPGDAETLGGPIDTPSLLCLAMICIQDQGPATANLLGPLVIHRHSRRGVQAIREDLKYSARAPLASPEAPECA